MADSNIQTLDTVKPITLDEYQERTAHLQENTTSLLSTIADRQVYAAGLATQAATLASEVNAVAKQARLSFSKKTWTDNATSGTPITAAELNRLENAISSLTTAVNNLQDSVSPKYSDNTAGVPGWSGNITIRYLPHNMLGVYAFIYTANLSTDPWQNAIQPSYKPTNWSGWCINLGKVAASRHVYSNICNFQKYDNGGYATYRGALNPPLLIDANNMYVYIGNKDIWSANAAILRISTVLKL